VTNRSIPPEEQANVVARFASSIEETIGFLLWDAVRSYQRAISPILAERGIKLGHYHFLRVLYEHAGLTLRELSDAAHMRGPTVVEAVRDMERRGLVRRKRDPDDARKVHLFLTAKGRRAHDALVPASARVNRIGVAGLSLQDQERLKEMLRHLRRNMNEHVGMHSAIDFD
jgi:MarR family transcriptional regulator, organic hydroperoxide resistance regulator